MLEKRVEDNVPRQDFEREIRDLAAEKMDLGEENEGLRQKIETLETEVRVTRDRFMKCELSPSMSCRGISADSSYRSEEDQGGSYGSLDDVLRASLKGKGRKGTCRLPDQSSRSTVHVWSVSGART